ncbi:glycosyltransferase family 2 protein [Patescibacteria group bacterium]|nr:glycosyltransferase family 2 protein [Patescibacteria group bacterium]
MTAKTKYRILEIIPGLSLWLTFILIISLSFIKPLYIIYFIILYDLYWLIRIMYFITYLFISWRKYQKVNKNNWLSEVKKISTHEKNWQDYTHLIIMATYRESYKVLRTTLQGLANTDYDTQKMIVIFSRECAERSGQNYEQEFKTGFEKLKQEFGYKFQQLEGYIHPIPPANELQGKGSSCTWAIKKAQREIIDAQKIPYENIIVSNFDSDTMVYSQYFSRLTYLWMTAENPHRHSYQPLTLYNNNIWDAPSFARVVANSTTFWLMMEKARPERMFTFSSHSMSFKTLVEVGYWETDIVTEDSRIFLQCFDYFDGNYSVIPMFVPISMDTVMGENTWETVKHQYKQMRRWAWSVEHFPWMITHFARNKKIVWSKKIKYLFNQSEGQYSWATGPIFILVLGRLPLTVAALSGEQLAIVQNAPFVLETLMSLAMIGIIVSALVNIYFLPARPAGHKKHKWIFMIAQWILLPITMILFGSIPALDAQTRLMLGGKYRLGFHVTKKHRK